ncbi:MAG: hypothetical protein LBP53_06540 [Candidatus Peribacteria bacterium]|jgi:hypothetical protein|nr:hypothetical protein [Candidatus Peribacteria bacterium]
MRPTITLTDNGIKIGEHLVFNPHTPVIGIINLQADVGAEMAYDRGNLLFIDFP